MCGVILFTGVYQWPIAHYSYLPLQPGLMVVGIAWINDIAFVFGRTEKCFGPSTTCKVVCNGLIVHSAAHIERSIA